MIYFLIFIVLFAIQLVYFRLANRFNIIDKPNQRSSHTRITLRGGGVIFYFGVLIFFLFKGFQYPWFLAGLTLISFISFADDLKPQSNKLRLLIHFTSMLLMFYQWGLFGMSWYFILIALVVSTGILNAYNFMDGINGITGGYSLVVAGALFYINVYVVPFIDSELIIYLILSLLVFNFFNFRTKAKCFAGDVGAISIGFSLIFLIGKLIISTNDFSYIVLLSVYGVDTVLTIIHRLILKENIFEAHRKHAYQLLANELKIPHLLVSTFYALLQVLIVIGFMIFKASPYWYLVTVIILLMISYILFKRKYFHLVER